MLYLSDSERFRSMSNTELLSVVFDKEYKLMEKSANILFENGYTYVSTKEFAEKAEVDEDSAKKILAVAELMKRQPHSKKKMHIASTDDAYNYVADLFKGLDHEEMFGLFLNNAGNVVNLQRFSIGTYNNVFADVRQVMREALNCKATAIILLHNHPSGSLNPSSLDISLTKKFLSAGEIMEVKLLDHLIVTDESYCSLSATTDLFPD